MFERARFSSIMFYVEERVIRLMRLCCSVFSGKYFHESFFLFSVLRALNVFFCLALSFLAFVFPRIV